MIRADRSNRERVVPRSFYDHPTREYSWEDEHINRRTEHWYRPNAYGYTYSHPNQDNDQLPLEGGGVLVRTTPRSANMSGFNGIGRRGTPGLYGNTPNLSFGKAMKALEREIDTAQNFYEGFLREYDGWISNRSDCLTDDLLNAIWKNMIVGKKYKNSISSDQNNNSNNELEEYTQKFSNQKREITRAMSCALRSTMRGGRESSLVAARLNSARRLQEKIETAQHQITPLTDAALEGREHCVALIAELKMLKNVMDAESTKELIIEDDENDGEDD
ncbi:hypothetical protein B0J14DRAFT_598901 [Halenospora varia]|nr:hypothetical protein B0J14DRAFT_598901 [Halenospora varia]